MSPKNPPLLPPKKLAEVYVNADVRARRIPDALLVMKWIAGKTNLDPAEIMTMWASRYLAVDGWYLPREQFDGR